MRQLARSCHLAGPQLVEDLAGLGVTPWVVLGRLMGGENGQGLDGQLGAERQGLERGDERILPEERREPWIPAAM